MQTLRSTVLLLVASTILSLGCSREDSKQAQRVQLQRELAAMITHEAGKDAIIVNGTAITEGALLEEEGRLTQDVAGRVNAKLLDDMKDGIRQRAIDNLIDRTLLKQTAEKEGIEAPEELVDSRIAEIKQRYETEEAFSDGLASLGITETDLREEIETGLRMEALLDKHARGTQTPTESEIEHFYEANKTWYQHPERVRASHIRITIAKDDSDTQKAKKKQKLTKILDEIRKGADFAEMASKYSDCASADRAGDLGYLQRGRMPRPFEDAAFSLKVGEMSDIVETDYAYHIIRITDRIDARTIPLEKARDEIIAYLEDQKREETMLVYIDSLRSSAVIEYADSSWLPK